MPWKHWSAERLGLILAILAALGFSFKAIFVKLAYAVPQAVPVDSVTLLCLRMAFSVPVFAWVGWRASRNLAPLTRRDWLLVIALGLLGYYGASILDFIGLQYITASLERLILFTYPTLTILIGVLFMGKRASRREMGALLLSYGDFFKEVERARYDVELLSQIFGTTYETVAHRLCNLADPKRAGVPFHFLRSDIAGNISKRYSGTGLKFAQGGGSCGKWAVHLAFLNPSQLTRQYSMMPDGTTYFCFAKVQLQPIGGSIVRGTAYSIGLGTNAENAQFLAYGLPTTDLRRDAVPTGIGCRFCERTDCNQRAAPSYKFAFSIDEYVKKENFFSPLTTGDAKKDT